jgi:hypothetical protein
MGFLDKLLGRTKKTDGNDTADSSMGMQGTPSATAQPAASDAPMTQDEEPETGEETPPA